METENHGLEISVAILMDDPSATKEIASALRQHNILAYYYQTLEEFWVGSNIKTPDLTIVDVTKMGQGGIQFKSHPKVIDGSLSYIFFSKDSTKILLQSTLGLAPLGYLHQDISLSAQINCLVSKRIQELVFKRERGELEDRVERLQNHTQKLISERVVAREFKTHFEFIKNFCQTLEADALKMDFTQALVLGLEKWDLIDGYGVYGLNQSGQKLISPEISKKKFHPFPSLWLGEVNKTGIEDFALEMAKQVANDLFEYKPVCIKIHAKHSDPDFLIFLSFKSENISDFPWDLFETLISSSLKKVKLIQNLPQFSSQFIPLWEAMDLMDHLQKEGIEMSTKIVSLSFIPLTKIIQKKQRNKFFWSSFFNDFFLQLANRTDRSTKISLLGPWHVLFFMSSSQLENETNTLKNFIRSFGYWKFFEDDSEILSEDMLPNLNLIPPSSAQYLKIFAKEFYQENSSENLIRSRDSLIYPTKRLST